MSTQRLPREQRIEQILDATLGLIREKPIPSIRSAEIARAVGISEAALFQHFARKEDVFEQIIRGYVHCRHPLAPAEEIESVEDFRAVIEEYVESMMRLLPRRIAYLKLLLQISMNRHPLARTKYEQVRDGFWALMEDRIEYGKRHWGFDPDFDTRAQVRLFHLGLLMFFIEQEVFGADEYDRFDMAEVRTMAVDNLLALLQAGDQAPRGEG